MRGARRHARRRVHRGCRKKLRAAFLWRIGQEGQHTWISALAAEFPDEFAQTIIPEPPDEAAPQDWHDLYWRAWDALRFDRPYGHMGGMRPVSYLALAAYAKYHGIHGIDFDVFRALFRVIDAEWIAHVDRETQKQLDEQRRRAR